MRAKVAIVLAVSTLFLGCGGSTSAKPNAASNLFLSDALHVSFRVPPGWAAPKSWIQIKKSPWGARFESPGKDAAVTAAQAPFAGINCVAAAQAALTGAVGGSLDVEKEFEVRSGDGSIPAGSGSTSSESRRGLARFFCRGKTAVIVEASAKDSAFDDLKAQLESIADSVSYEGEGSQQVAIRPPAAAPAPTFFEHTVRSRGETLGQIAEWYTGSYDNWRKLARVNEDTPVPNTGLKVGRTIRIPAELVIRQDPLPKPKRKSTTVKSEAKPKASEEEEAETTGLPKAEEEAPELPNVIGPR